VIEALVGGNFAEEIDVEWLVGDLDAASRKQALKDMKRNLATYEKKLKEHRPILVGHNQMLDLCFIYRTFFGPLPDKLEDFQRDIQFLFPRIADTKYMATRGGHDMLAENSLEEWFASLKEEIAPKMTCQTLFGYLRRAPHQAGYDSKKLEIPRLNAMLTVVGYMTAVLFVKLSWKLSRSPRNFRFIEGEDDSDDIGYFTPDKDGVVSPARPSSSTASLPLLASQQQVPSNLQPLRRIGGNWGTQGPLARLG
jgi:poly(A)-specific ribonuclease